MKHILGSNSKSTLSNVQDGDSQPNACDLRLDKVFQIQPNLFEISNEHKVHRGSREILPDEHGYFTLYPGAYEVIMENLIHVGEGEAGWVITRSTLNRNGCFISSGLYDSNYSGPMAAVLHVTVDAARIKKGTRVGQYLSFDAEMLHPYNGSYGSDSNGNVREEQKKFNY